MDTDYSLLNIQPNNEPLLAKYIAKPKQAQQLKLDTLTRLQVIGYSLGHFQNDLCAACWFNYLLYYMKNVVFRTDPNSGFYAGIVLLSGQIADGIATPLVGFFSDKTNTKIGKRTPWYLFGFIMVTVCFVFIFQNFDTNNTALRISYYIFFPSMFNVGWAAVQVAHMSLVPSLTLSRRTRDKLNNFRNTFTYVANLYVLLLAFFLFLLLDSDYLQFRVLALASLGLGVLTSIFFLVTVNEKKITEGCKQIKKNMKKNNPQLSIDSACAVFPSMAEPLAISPGSDDETRPAESMDQLNCTPPLQSNIDSNIEIWKLPEEEVSGEIHISHKKKSESVNSSFAEEVVCWKQWFKIPSFYIYGFVYMAVRLLVNVQSSLIIFYLQNVLGIAKGVNTFQSGLPTEFAVIPIIIYLSSTISSTSLKMIYSKIGRKKTFTLGAIAALAGAIIMLFLEPDSKNFIYPTAVLMGIGQSISLNTGITLIGEVVGVKGSSGAFVFGAYSLLDKFSNGIVLYLVMNLKDVSDPNNAEYVRICATAFPGIATVLAWILIIIGKAADYDAGDVVMDKSVPNEVKKHLKADSK